MKYLKRFAIRIAGLACLTAFVFYGCDDQSNHSNQIMHSHEWGEQIVIRAAGCEEDGEGKQICIICGAEEARVIRALGHDWGEWEVSAAPTCTEEGEGTRACARCGEGDDHNHTIPKLMHDWGGWNMTIVPTCTEEGGGLRACVICGAEDDAVINALGHDWGALIQITAATITDDGAGKRICGRDHSHEESLVLYATGTPGLEYRLGWYSGYYNNGEHYNNYGYQVAVGAATGSEVRIPAYWRQNAEDEYFPVVNIRNDGGSYFYSSVITSLTVAGGNTAYRSEGDCIIRIADNELALGCVASVIPSSVTVIGDKAFRGCSGLASVTIPDSVTSIGDEAFRGCSGLTSVTIGNSVTVIGNSAFTGCKLTTVTIPDSVTSIGVEAFTFCRELASVTIGNGVTSIGNYAFYEGGKLASVTIGNSVTSIGSSAFNGCLELTSVTFEGTIPADGFGYDYWGNYSSTFPGDLRDKFYAADPANGTPGTYTRPNGSSLTWTRQ
ncbi:MAG: leucine-rich repeat domain-containing protein [Treponema sp.]|jgi:hypothetical protein|nr:leucine-rich repeat domain-containing protein [Treponema sp.]